MESKRLTIRLDDPLYSRLRELAAQNGEDMADIVRRGIRTELKISELRERQIKRIAKQRPTNSEQL